ncbi:hypothetical protein CLF_102850 [Clonorchis sinensis]|uniref:BED-type domain-containing protein n=1 Tax=Clonorchis sinensis TaxID=79923 RepID=G7Y8N4_CLOSI|nr:hypothetical protein CLF_102850 [Clonorchis sinensis]
MEPQVLPTSLRSPCGVSTVNDFQIEGEALLDSEKDRGGASGVQELYICGSPGADEDDEADNESHSSPDFPFYKARSECSKSVDQENLEPRELQTTEFDHDSSLSKETTLESMKINCTEDVESLPDRALKVTIKTASRGAEQSSRGPKTSTGTPKACAKKSFVWKYFHHPELASGITDRSRTQCILCDSQLAFNASGTTTTMLNHLKSRHGDIAEQEELQRRVSRPKGGNTRHLVADNRSSNEETDQLDTPGDLQRISLSGNRHSRSPVGQRGRPPVAVRRQKLTKNPEAMDYLSQTSALQGCQLKSDGGSMFPLGSYAALTEQQHRALINEMLFSAESLSALGKDGIVGANGNDQRKEVGALLPGMNLVGVGGHKFDAATDAALSCAANKMFSTPLFPRNSLLNAVSAFSNGAFGIPLPGQINCPAAQELSPSSSSGLGVSKRRVLEHVSSTDTEDSEATDMTNKPTEHLLVIPEISTVSSTANQVEKQISKPESRHVTQTTFLHNLIRYLVKDMQPPEVVEGEGFKSMIGFLTGCQLPSAEGLRAELLPRMVKEARENTVLRLMAHSEAYLVSMDQGKTNQNMESGSSEDNLQAMAFSVEIWPSASRARMDTVEDIKFVPGAAVHANLEVHRSSLRSSSLQSHVYDSIKVTDYEDLATALKKCCDQIRPTQNAEKFKSHDWAIPLVTNQVPLIQTIHTKSTEIQTDICEIAGREFLLIPCFVSQMIRAVMAGLNLAGVQRVLHRTKQGLQRKNEQLPASACYPNQNDEKTSDEDRNERLPHDKPMDEEQVADNAAQPSSDEEDIPENFPVESVFSSWAQAYTLIQSACDATVPTLTANDICVLQQLRHVLELLNQTLELIHRRDLVLTASMMEPLLQNLCQTHLASAEELPQENSEDQSRGRTVVEQFKSVIRESLMQAYPEDGAVRETLQLASLLDPRFKDHSEGQKPSVVSLLREKLEAVPTSIDCTSKQQNFSSTDPSPIPAGGKTTKPSSDTTGLRTVFGLQCFARTSLSEVDRYLREEPLGLEENPFAWWSEKVNTYPRLAILANYYLTIPLTSFAVGRLTSLGSLWQDKPSEPHLYEPKDGLGLPNIVDPLGRNRVRIAEDDQATYNFLWHNLDKINEV